MIVLLLLVLSIGSAEASEDPLDVVMKQRGVPKRLDKTFVNKEFLLKDASKYFAPEEPCYHSPFCYSGISGSLRLVRKTHVKPQAAARRGGSISSLLNLNDNATGRSYKKVLKKFVPNLITQTGCCGRAKKLVLPADDFERGFNIVITNFTKNYLSLFFASQESHTETSTLIGSEKPYKAINPGGSIGIKYADCPSNLQISFRTSQRLSLMRPSLELKELNSHHFVIYTDTSPIYTDTSSIYSTRIVIPYVRGAPHR